MILINHIYVFFILFHLVWHKVQKHEEFPQNITGNDLRWTSILSLRSAKAGIDEKRSVKITRWMSGNVCGMMGNVFRRVTVPLWSSRSRSDLSIPIRTRCDWRSRICVLQHHPGGFSPGEEDTEWHSFHLNSSVVSIVWMFSWTQSLLKWFESFFQKSSRNSVRKWSSYLYLTRLSAAPVIFLSELRPDQREVLIAACAEEPACFHVLVLMKVCMKHPAGRLFRCSVGADGRRYFYSSFLTPTQNTWKQTLPSVSSFSRHPPTPPKSCTHFTAASVAAKRSFFLWNGSVTLRENVFFNVFSHRLSQQESAATSSVNEETGSVSPQI